MRTVIATIALLAVATLGFAFYRNWVEVEKQEEESTGKTKVALELDKQKVKKDVQEAKERAKEGADKVKEKLEEGAQKAGEELKDATNSVAGATIIHGTVADVNVEKNHVTVMVEEKKHEMEIIKETKILRNGQETPLNTLKKGMSVKVSYKEEDNVKVAWRILIEKKK